MRLNALAVKDSMMVHNVSQNQFARQIGVSKGFLSNACAGKRGVGRKMLAGLLRAFPQQSVSDLTISERQVF